MPGALSKFDIKDQIVVAGSSHTRGCDPDDVVYRGQYVRYHTTTHQDCLILPQPSGFPIPRHNIIRESKEYMTYKFGDFKTISFPGLNRDKIGLNKRVPGGEFKNYPIKLAFQSFESLSICLLVLGSTQVFIDDKSVHKVIT